MHPNQEELPWKIQVHFQRFPASQLLRCTSIETIEAHFMNTIKEATHLRFGSAKRIMSLSKAEQTQLWQAVQSHDFHKYWDIDSAITEARDRSEIRHLPIRCHLPSAPAVQLPVAPVGADAQKRTLGDALQIVLPHLFDATSIKECAHLVLCHGIVPPLGTDLMWLSQHSSCADGFLHLCI